MSVIHRVLSAALVPFLLASVAAIGCQLSAGASLGLFLGGLMMVTLLIPPLVITEDSSGNRLFALVAGLIPFTGLYAWGAWNSETRFTELLAAVGILTANAVALAGVTLGFRLLRISSALSAALTVVLGLAWMTWPIWLSRTWNGEASAPGVARLVNVHPGMAINGVLIHQFSPWSEQSVAYHLTDLSQNVPYTLPPTPWACILLHMLLGGALLGLAGYWESRAARGPQFEVIAQPS